MTNPNISVTARRRARQHGSEIVEFALLSVFLVPTLLYTFVNAMNLIRMIETTHICRDLGNLYIHGVDYSTYEAQTVAERLARGFNLRIGNGFAGNNANNNNNGGNAYVVVSEVMYVGAASCASLPAGTSCTNQNRYVFLQRIDFGSKALKINNVTVRSKLGDPAVVVNSSGYVQDYLTDPDAVAESVSTLFTQQFTDGQVAYVVETFFASPDLSFSALPGGGIHSIIFL